MLAQAHRIRRGEDFRRVVRGGRRIGGRVLLGHVLPTTATSPARFGFIVSRAIGSAPARNRLRRRLRALCREAVDAGFVGSDIVFRALPGAGDAPFSELREHVQRTVNAGGRGPGRPEALVAPSSEGAR